MAAFHQTIVLGNLGKDPETRFLPSGDAVCNFSVAVTEKFKSKDGDTKESTTWYRVNAFGRLAEICGEYLRKGSAVMVTGRMQARQWEKDGVKRESWELRADSLQMLGGKSERSEPRGESQPKPRGESGFEDMPDDLIPF